MSVLTMCREVGSADSIQDVELDAALERWRGGDGSFWIVLDADAPDEAARWLGARHLVFSGLESLPEPSHGVRS